MSYYVHDLDPIAFEIFGMPFPWYWLVYFAGYFWVYSSVKYLIQKNYSSLKLDEIHNFLFYGFLILLFSGKIFYILFYNLNFYLQNPSEVLAVWKGGMSFHGALVGCAAWTWFYSKKKSIKFLELADPFCTVTPLVLFFGRLANFINGELAGRVSNVSWAVIFPKLYDTQPRHPSQIYEAVLEGLILFFILWFSKGNMKKRVGLQSVIFLAGYGVARFIVEFFRLADPQIGYIFGYFTIGQFYCLLMIILAFFIHRKSQISLK
jgi:phosphatidylglycerol:prolipoprotein diacylglycerol transferase